MPLMLLTEMIPAVQPSVDRARLVKRDSDVPTTMMLLLHQRLALTLNNLDKDSTNTNLGTKRRDDLNISKFWENVCRCAAKESFILRNYTHPTTNSTPLHEACKLPHVPIEIFELLYVVCVDTKLNALDKRDKQGNIPLHYAMSLVKKDISLELVNFLLANTTASVRQTYLSSFHQFEITTKGSTRQCSVSPLYRAAQSYMPKSILLAINRGCPRMLCAPVMVSGDDSEGSDNGDDTPLFLLWRRYQNYKWQSEKFFLGDNSRQEVVDHRRKYSVLAVQALDTVIESIQLVSPGITVLHSLAKISCVAPPGLSMFVLDEFEDQAAVLNSKGQYPLHFAAESTTAGSIAECYQGKLVIDTLLKLYPAAVKKKDADGRLPLALAIENGRTADNGVSSLYNAYPAAFDEGLAATYVREKYDAIKEDLILAYDSLIETTDEEHNICDPKKELNEESKAVFIVQNPKVDVRDIVGLMVSNSDDAAVQMLGCVSLAKRACTSVESATHVALCGGIDAVVNAMSYNPDEPIIQEEACAALRFLAAANDRYDISFTSAGAILSMVSAMKDHPIDPIIQETASLTLGNVGVSSDSAITTFSAGGIKAMINALGTHPDDLGVQRRVVEALKKMSDSSGVGLPVAKEEIKPVLEAAARFDHASRAAVKHIIYIYS